MRREVALFLALVFVFFIFAMILQVSAQAGDFALFPGQNTYQVNSEYDLNYNADTSCIELLQSVEPFNTAIGCFPGTNLTSISGISSDDGTFLRISLSIRRDAGGGFSLDAFESLDFNCNFILPSRSNGSPSGDCSR